MPVQHTYLTYGPLLNGVTQVIYEGVPAYPQPNRIWQIVERHRVSSSSILDRGRKFEKAHSTVARQPPYKNTLCQEHMRGEQIRIETHTSAPPLVVLFNVTVSLVC